MFCAKSFDSLGTKRECRMVGHVEEVGAAKVFIALGLATLVAGLIAYVAWSASGKIGP